MQQIERLGGLGGLVFATLVIAQNVLRGAPLDAEASGADVLAHYADHRTALLAATGMVTVNLLALSLFVGALWSRAGAVSRGWLVTGTIGAACVMALFGLVAISDLTLTLGAERLAGEPGAAEWVFQLHNAAFAMVGGGMAAMTLGLSRAAADAGLVPAVFRKLGVIAATLFVVGSALPSLELIPVVMLGLLVWLALLVVAGLRLARASAAPRHSLAVTAA